MNKNKLKRNRPDFDGNERGIYNHNKAILRKTATVCALCGMPLDKSLKYPDPMSISIDHVIPVARGGKSTLGNLQATHLICNKEKGKKIINLNNVDSKSNGRNVKLALPQYIDWRTYKA